MRAAICDDELLYRQLIHEKLLQDSMRCDYETEISEYASASELLAAMEKGYSADVYFLDIQMSNGEDGIWAGRELRRRGVERLRVVYSTAPVIAAQADGASGRPVPGSVSWVPGVAGMILAGDAVQQIVGRCPSPRGGAAPATPAAFSDSPRADA